MINVQKFSGKIILENKMAQKVGFLAFLGSNYGTVLQSFALFQTIKKLGYDCEVIGANEFRNREIPNPDITDIHSKEFDKLKTHITFEQFISRWFIFNEILGDIPANAKINESQKKEIQKFSAFVCGSDQIWKPAGFWFCAKRYLQFAPEEKRIGYAPSVGWNKVELKAVGNIPQWRTWLSSVKYLSTRETTGSFLVEKMTGRHVETVLDPTFLLRPEQWTELLPYGVVSDEINKQLMTGRPYLLAYLLDSYDKYNEYVRRLAARLNLDIIWLTGRDNVGPIQRNCATTDPAGFVQLIRNASFICADGFHGTCFSLNFSKPFVLLTNEDSIKNDSRMQDLMKRLGVSGRIVKLGDDPSTINPEIDYISIRKNIDIELENSLNYLRESIKNASINNINLLNTLKNTTDKAISFVQNEVKKSNIRTTNHVPLDNPDNCTGCGACLNICPLDAIQMKPNENGFLNPVVDEKKCINCGKCLNNCPIRRRPDLYLREKLTKAYAAWATNPFIISRSASGGMFPLFANWIFENNGVAYGVAWDKKFNAHMVCAVNNKELLPICGSKYVQASTGYIYRDVKDKLDNGIPVLFSGTSCQIAGLYAYLNGDSELLITIDLLCGGTPSPMVFRKYLEWREQQFGSQIVGVEFRSKIQKGWGLGMVLKFTNGKILRFPMQQDEYGILYNQHFIQRPACYGCRFRGIENRWADITIGDFWGIGRHGIPFKYERTQGISVVLPNSIKGRALFQSVAADSKNIIVEQRNLDEVYPGNAWLTKNFVKRRDYNNLYKLLREESFAEAFNRYFGDESIRKSLKL